MTRQISPIGLEHIKQWEGLKLTAYFCSAGKLTIGYGHTFASGAPIVTKGMTITKLDANRILKHDLLSFEKAVSETIAVPLHDNQFSALVSFAFNVGVEAFKSSNLVKKLNKENYDAVPGELMKWVKITNPKTGKKVTAKGLVNRRAAECGLWAKGDFVSSAYIAGTPDKPKVLLKPEVIGPAVGALSGMTGFATGSGPAQWAFSVIMVGAFVVTAAYFIRRMKDQSA